jgi:hypothetical protein
LGRFFVLSLNKGTKDNRMRIQSEKLDAIRLLTELNDAEIIRHIKAILSTQKDLWDELPASIKSEIDIANEELKAGKGISHKKMISKYKKWL